MGNAYGFFDCKFDKGIVRMEIEERLRGKEKTISLNLGLLEEVYDKFDTSLLDTLRNSSVFGSLDWEIIDKDKQSMKRLTALEAKPVTDLKYAIEASMGERNNRETACYLDGFLFHLHKSNLFKKEEINREKIFYKNESGIYVPLY